MRWLFAGAGRTRLMRKTFCRTSFTNWWSLSEAAVENEERCQEGWEQLTPEQRERASRANRGSAAGPHLAARRKRSDVLAQRIFTKFVGILPPRLRLNS